MILKTTTPSLGSDPEFFFVGNKTGNVRGSERIIPEAGIKVASSEFVRDGIQVELHPNPSTCRALAAHEIVRCMKGIRDVLQKDGRFNLSFDQVVKVTSYELGVLSEDSKKFGCAPSFNSHNEGKESEITVNPAKYKYRSAGGHIHIGSGDSYPVIRNYDVMAQVLDVILGNTCVLLDRHPLTKERRKVYGRAGEYRKPVYGIEYRVLSNFWMKSYQLMSLVYGLARFSVTVMNSHLEDDLLKRVDMSKVIQAINENDYELALENFATLEAFIGDLKIDIVYRDSYGVVQLLRQDFPIFRYFASMGMDHWFPQDPLEHWCSLGECHGQGWESYLVKTLHPAFDALSAADRKKFE